MLQAGRIDGFVRSISTLENLKKKLGRELDLEIHLLPINTSEQHFLFSRKTVDEALIARFNASLLNLKKKFVPSIGSPFSLTKQSYRLRAGTRNKALHLAARGHWRSFVDTAPSIDFDSGGLGQTRIGEWACNLETIRAAIEVPLRA